ncbi:MAG: histone deacetylase [Candidatus Bipolaricaulota bacterium]
MPILFDEGLEEYNFGRDHPFTGERFTNFPRMLERYFEGENYRLVKAEPVDEREVRKIAGDEYIEFTSQFFNSSNLERDSSDFSKYHSQDNMPGRRSGKMETAARLILGQAKKACDIVVKDQAKAISIGGGFHHAKPDSGEGFCLYNDVAFAAKYLLENHEADRVMILDTDAHFGNGTYEYFSDSHSVLQVDIHQDPSTIYPGTGFAEQVGRDAGEGYTINIPMPERAGDNSYEHVFKEVVVPVTLEFDPSVIIRNGGGDPYVGDPLTNLGLSLEGLTMVGELVSRIQNDVGSGLVDLMVSGYSNDKLHACWIALIAGLMGKEIETEELDHYSSEGRLAKSKQVVKKVKNIHKNYWSF